MPEPEYSTSRSALARRVAGRPRRWLLGAAAVALLAGIGIGAVSASQQSELDATRAELDEVRSELTIVKRKLDAESDRAREAEADRAEAQERIERLTASGDVPSFVGDRVGDVESDELVAELDWDIKVQRRATREASPGEIVAQVPRAGTELKRGRTIRLVVAKAPPKRWVTIASFSGSGANRTDEFTIPGGYKTRIAYTFTGDTNAILDLKKPGDEFGGDLILNEIGDYSDTTRLYDKSGTYYLEIEGGSWSVQIQQFK